MREFETPVIEVKPIDVADEVTSSIETIEPSTPHGTPVG